MGHHGYRPRSTAKAVVPIGARVDQCGVVATEKTPAIPADIAVGLTEVALLREFFALPLAAKLNEVLSDPERLTSMSARNAKTAALYESSLLAVRRPPFYQELRTRTEAWLDVSK